MGFCGREITTWLHGGNRIRGHCELDWPGVEGRGAPRRTTATAQKEEREKVAGAVKRSSAQPRSEGVVDVSLPEVAKLQAPPTRMGDPMVDRDRLPSLDDRFWEPRSPYQRSCRSPAPTRESRRPRTRGTAR